MPTTPKGIEYPDSSAHTRLWEHYQALAETADTALSGPIAVLSASVAQSVPSGSLIPVDFDTLDHQSGDISVSGSTIVLDTPGVYIATATGVLSSTAAVRALIEIRLTSGERIARDGDGGDATSRLRYMSAAGFIVAAGGEVVQCQLYHEHGTALDTANFPFPRFGVARVA